MVERLAKNTSFSTTNDVLRMAMTTECTRKYKAYPAFLRRFGFYWKKYTTNQISTCLKDHNEYIFKTWFSRMLYFDPNRIQILDANKTSDVDFNAKLIYEFTNDEIRFIENIIQKYSLPNVRPLLVMNQLMYTGLRLLGPVVKKFFGRPYDFQLETAVEEESQDGKIIKIFFTSREA